MHERQGPSQHETLHRDHHPEKEEGKELLRRGGPVEATQLPGGVSLGQRTEGPKRFGGLTTNHKALINSLQM